MEDLYLVYVTLFSERGSLGVTKARIFSTKGTAYSYIKLLTKDWSFPFSVTDYENNISASDMTGNVVNGDYDKLAHIQRLGFDKEVTIYTQQLPPDDTTEKIFEMLKEIKESHV